MIVNLAEIDPHKPLSKSLTIASQEMETVSGKVIVNDLDAQLTFRVDPMGYLVEFEVSAKAVLNCIRCSGRMEERVQTRDWIALRLKHPTDAHLILVDAEMNVRFIEDLNFDVLNFIAETIELELPTYPKHEERDPDCSIPAVLDLGELGESKDSGQNSGPFAALSKFLQD